MALPFAAPPTTSIAWEVVSVNSSILARVPGPADLLEIEASIDEMAAAVQAYVPGYRLKQKVQFEVIPADKPVNIPGVGQFSGLKTAVYLEVEGAAHYLPAYAGNLDIMTSAAMSTAEKMAQTRVNVAGEVA